MATGRDLVQSAMRLIGAIAPGETASAQEATDGLSTAVRMLANWSTENLIVYGKVREEFALTSGVSRYTMGPSGTFNTSRPIRIDAVAVQLLTANAHEIPVRLIETNHEWAKVLDKGLVTDFPMYVMVEGTFPAQTLDVYPVPVTPNKLVIYSKKPLVTVSDLSSEVVIPPEYEEPIIYNLAVRLSPEYGRPVSAEVAMIAMETKANIKRLNDKPNYLRVDSALVARGRYNILTGGYE